MITRRRISSYLRARPFRPFRITTASGRTFDIRHPEMIELDQSTMFVFLFVSNEPEEMTEHQVEISLLLTESIEPLDASTRPQGA